jgi:hypothetical protein
MARSNEPAKEARSFHPLMLLQAWEYNLRLFRKCGIGYGLRGITLVHQCAVLCFPLTLYMCRAKEQNKCLSMLINFKTMERSQPPAILCKVPSSIDHVLSLNSHNTQPYPKDFRRKDLLEQQILNMVSKNRQTANRPILQYLKH